MAEGSPAAPNAARCRRTADPAEPGSPGRSGHDRYPGAAKRNSDVGTRGLLKGRYPVGAAVRAARVNARVACPAVRVLIRLAALAAVLLAISGCAQAGTESEAAGGGAASPAEHVAARASHHPMRGCGGGILANAHASCVFARNVSAAFGQSGSDAVEAYSPATGRHYTLVCLPIDDETRVQCTTGEAGITFPAEQSAARASEPAQAAGGGEDALGSSSHATDEQFCEEHECIGDFEGEDGTVVECADGSYSHAGGISGACSDHGGET